MYRFQVNNILQNQNKYLRITEEKNIYTLNKSNISIIIKNKTKL